MQGRSAYVGSSDESAGSDHEEDEEFPWCVMCNDDAVLRCVQCDELFCKPCYKDIHKDRDRRHHKSHPYPAPGSASARRRK